MQHGAQKVPGIAHESAAAVRYENAVPRVLMCSKAEHTVVRKIHLSSSGSRYWLDSYTGQGCK